MKTGWCPPLCCMVLVALLSVGCGGHDPSKAGLTIDAPLDGSVFPPDFVPPTFLWHDETPGADRWRIEAVYGDGTRATLATSNGPPPPMGEIDEGAIGPTNSLYEGTPYQQSARSWTPPDELWSEIQGRTVESPATIEIVGTTAADPKKELSRGAMTLTTSRDPVGAPIFYRDVPLMATRGKDGVIVPLDPEAFPRIKWRLRDVSRPDSKVLLQGMVVCANCHSFSQDGATLGMDVDGPTGDKGAYAMAPLAPQTVIDSENVITWNSFPKKVEGSRTIGFLSRISPDGQTAISTVNEELYVTNFTTYKFLQVFYPTRGILAWCSKETGEMKALPGADDPAYVHCNAVWFPDGKSLVFLRAKAVDPYPEGQPRATYAGDPNETPMRYDLYRIPFNDGKGGTPVPIEGASDNGKSNTFPKISPDGKWIVYTKCDNGLLMRPDGKLWIVPAEGGAAREMNCNTPLMNSWHSFSPNGRWLVFSSKSNTPYTQLFLTHIDEDGNDTPAILLPNSTAANRAANIPEFVNRDYADFNAIDMPAVDHHRHFTEGHRLAREKRYTEAIPFLELSIGKEPDFIRANAELGRVLLELGRFDEARKRLDYTLSLDPSSGAAHVNLGTVSLRENKVAEARAEFETAIRVEPDFALAHYNLGILLRDAGQTEKSIACFTEAIRLDPEDPHAHNGLGWVLQMLGRWDEAMAEYRAALEVDARHDDARANLLAALRNRGLFEELVSALGKLVEADPENLGLRLSLAWELSTRPEDRLRDGPRALLLAQGCHQVAGDRPAVLDVMAAALAEKGEYDVATAVAQRALNLLKAGKGTAAPGVEDRLKLYRSGQPYRQP